MRRTAFVMFLAITLGFVAGCSRTQTARDFSGLTTFDGRQATHINTTNYAIDLLFVPLVGDATLENTVSDMTFRAKAMGASEVRIVQSSSKRLWYIFPPFSFIVHPVIGNAAADVLPAK